TFACLSDAIARTARPKRSPYATWWNSLDRTSSALYISGQARWILGRQESAQRVLVPLLPSLCLRLKSTDRRHEGSRYRNKVVGPLRVSGHTMIRPVIEYSTRTGRRVDRRDPSRAVRRFAEQRALYRFRKRCSPSMRDRTNRRRIAERREVRASPS